MTGFGPYSGRAYEPSSYLAGQCSLRASAYEPHSYLAGQCSLRASAYEPHAYLTRMAAPPAESPESKCPKEPWCSVRRHWCKHLRRQSSDPSTPSGRTDSMGGGPSAPTRLSTTFEVSVRRPRMSSTPRPPRRRGGRREATP